MKFRNFFHKNVKFKIFSLMTNFPKSWKCYRNLEKFTTTWKEALKATTMKISTIAKTCTLVTIPVKSCLLLLLTKHSTRWRYVTQKYFPPFIMTGHHEVSSSFDPSKIDGVGVDPTFHHQCSSAYTHCVVSNQGGWWARRTFHLSYKDMLTNTDFNSYS